MTFSIISDLMLMSQVRNFLPGPSNASTKCSWKLTDLNCGIQNVANGWIKGLVSDAIKF